MTVHVKHSLQTSIGTVPGFEPASGSEYLIYRWESDIDGILQEDETRIGCFETHLSIGLHTITLALDDGINPQVSSNDDQC